MKKIQPAKNIDSIIRVPGSKSITQRAIIAAALSNGTTILHGPLASEDTEYTSSALGTMGIEVLPEKDKWLVRGTGGRLLAPDREIFLGNNGTATRFLTSVAALGQGDFTITGEKRMQKRPIGPLIEALRGWGVDIVSVNDTDCPPVRISARGITGGSTVLPEGKSSQYISSLLLVAPYAGEKAVLDVKGVVPSKPYIEMTLAVIKAFGIEVAANRELNHFEIEQGAYRARKYLVEGDASSASYFFAAAALTGGTVRVANITRDSLQGDTALIGMLEQMGCTVTYNEGVTVQGPAELQAVEVNMGDCPDVAPTLTMVAARARGRTVISNIAHLRIKECDRINAVATELTRIGVKVEEREDALVIHGDPKRPLHGAEIETYGDHRIAMCFAVLGLVVPEIVITGEDCVAKSFPEFWEVFEELH